MEAPADIANHLVTELWWHRTFPFKPSLTGEPRTQLADDFESSPVDKTCAPYRSFDSWQVAVPT